VRANTVTQVRAALAQASGERLRTLIETHSDDHRTGVQAAIASAALRLQRETAEEQRLADLNALEERLRADGFARVAGVDEVGRGALAGPLTAAAVVLPPGARICGLDDSKRLSPKRRTEVAHDVRRVALSVGVAHVPAHVVDALGVTAALRWGMERALAALEPPADHALTDGLRMGLSLPETPVVKGDSSVAAIAAASVVAKVARDALMTSLAACYPLWEFEVNKGYGTAEHLGLIERHGLCPLHRRSFGPCSQTPTLF